MRLFGVVVVVVVLVTSGGERVEAGKAGSCNLDQNSRFRKMQARKGQLESRKGGDCHGLCRSERSQKRWCMAGRSGTPGPLRKVVKSVKALFGAEERRKESLGTGVAKRPHTSPDTHTPIT